MASSTELSTTSHTRWCKPISPVEPMYIAGRSRTASRPPRTLMDFASYLWPLGGVTAAFSLSPMCSPRAPIHRANRPRQLDPERIGVSIRGWKKIVWLEARKAYLRIDPCVALPFDSGFPGANPKLVGFLLHPVPRSETWRRLIFLQV